MPADRRPLTARSVVASTLLGVQPPRLPTRILVQSGELFGIAEGTTRVALSRMVAQGELRPDGDGYRLAGRLLDRQARQSASRRAETEGWDGTWELALVRSGRARRPADRAALRQALSSLRLSELREGVWLRPANLPAGRAPAARAVAAGQCLWVAHAGLDPAPDPAELWDLAGWAAEARSMREELSGLLPRLTAGDTGALGVGFVTSAAALRLLQHDPLLPSELRPDRWPGDALRRDYDRYDAAYRAVWTTWFRRQRDGG
ncbi:MAG TPA: PaaX family transcriptional regulator C-terminal domain-containing protein [Acidimicrobiales bacterium]|nr:PaaX family transcriptional regulator C-terminal domain-containing protein [Acidimicrobiales bacterium]